MLASRHFFGGGGGIKEAALVQGARTYFGPSCPRNLLRQRREEDKGLVGHGAYKYVGAKYAGVLLSSIWPAK